MRHHIYETNPYGRYEVAILVKDTSMQVDQIREHYVKRLTDNGIPLDTIIVFNLAYDSKGKASAKYIREYLEELSPVLANIGAKKLLVCDTNYFKVFAKQQRTSGLVGYPFDVVLDGLEGSKCFLSLNHRTLPYAPENIDRINMSIDALSDSFKGSFKAIGSDIIHSSEYPETVPKIKEFLNSIMDEPIIFSDIETFSLSMFESGIGSIGFSKDKHNGGSFLCDYVPLETPVKEGSKTFYGEYVPNQEIREIIKDFFTNYKGKVVWHNSSFDLKILVYVLWMKHDLDHVGMLEGIDVMTRLIDDTKIIAYLATNSAQGNSLGLKELAHEFAGNFALDPETIKDIRLVPYKGLLKYNLIDCLSTCYVYDKYLPIMIEDKQTRIYEEVFLPSVELHLRMELHGLPLNEEKLNQVDKDFNHIRDNLIKRISENPLVKSFNNLLRMTHVEKRNASLKTKQITLDCEETLSIEFNPASPQQRADFFHNFLKLDVVSTTASGEPATGEKEVEIMKNSLDKDSQSEVVELFENLVEYNTVNKVLGTFISAFKNGRLKADGARYVHGNFNIGGAVSGRLSSSAPNLQNIIMRGIYGKGIKEAVQAPKGKLFGGADFESLEDKVYALYTKDPNRLKVYTDGFDGHSLRAFAYYAEQMPDIVNTVESINSIKDKYPHLRDAGKNPTFLLTYLGTMHGLMRNYGFSEEFAKSLVERYNYLYKEGIAFINSILKQAEKDGYVTCAFGLRVRTPLLKRKGDGLHVNKNQFSSERRTAGNALGQSFCVLNSRAAVGFLRRLKASDFNLKVHPVALIHDAIYLVFDNDLDTLKWVNDNLIAEMGWNELEEIQHDIVKISAEFEVFYPSWNNPVKIPNNSSEEEILKIVEKYNEKLSSTI